MRWLGILVRIVGWLLTPLVAWAVSFYGAWVILKLTGGLEDPRHTIYAAFAGALITAIVLLLIWLHLLRRSPKLRHSLHVDQEGLPVLDEAAEGSQDREDGDSASEGAS